MNQSELKAYYRGRGDAFSGEGPDPHFRFNAELGVREEYRRGYRHAKAEDRLDADQEWDA